MTDQQIRDLCAQLLQAQGLEFESLIVDLQSGLRERFERLSNLAVATILKMPRQPLEEKVQAQERPKKFGT